ncbi:MAG TPA: Gfo/Idh/MocA family oxidoreductase [Stellaceae bacterium]|nr:Gfo/Idh/MocA family oxidoreductase [Stellaceae bacterium]
MAPWDIERTASKALRLAIVGFGKMGRLHLNAWRRLQEVSIAALVDIDPAKVDSMGGEMPFHTTCGPLIGEIDAAIIATPTAWHYDCALPLLEAGIHCLVEKPVATDLRQVRELTTTAAGSRATLAIGHSERFNEGIQGAQAALGKDATRIHVLRMLPARGGVEMNIDVVQDLMVHDLDWIICTLGKMPEQIRALDASRIDGRLEAITCELAFSDGLTVLLQASRVAQTRQRLVILDSGAQRQRFDLDVTRRVDPDPLTSQARAFVAAIRGEPTRIARAEEALRVMSVVEQIRQDAA